MKSLRKQTEKRSGLPDRRWNEIAGDYLAVAQEVFGALRPDIEAAAQFIARKLRKGNKLLICGNGGSAADAQHMAGELVNRFLLERKPYAAVALTTDTSVLTSVSNDYSFDLAFEKQVLALGRRGDVLLAISTSGKAANVLRAVETARRRGIFTIGLTGGHGGRLAAIAERVLCVSSTASTPRIQEGHQLIIHLLCERIEQILG
jgi:D-sedoheptulose 7-phosphate isomerase